MFVFTQASDGKKIAIKEKTALAKEMASLKKELAADRAKFRTCFLKWFYPAVPVEISEGGSGPGWQIEGIRLRRKWRCLNPDDRLTMEYNAIPDEIGKTAVQNAIIARWALERDDSRSDQEKMSFSKFAVHKLNAWAGGLWLSDPSDLLVGQVFGDQQRFVDYGSHVRRSLFALRDRPLWPQGGSRREVSEIRDLAGLEKNAGASEADPGPRGETQRPAMQPVRSPSGLAQRTQLQQPGTS